MHVAIRMHTSMAAQLLSVPAMASVRHRLHVLSQVRWVWTHNIRDKAVAGVPFCTTYV